MTSLLKAETKWFRVIVFAMVFMAIPAILEQSYASYQRHYYETQPIERFYKAVSLEAENVCVGTKVQNLKTVRYVYGTNTGWAVDIVRELYRIDPLQERRKVYNESANIFVESVPSGIALREGAIPVVPTGLYQWDIALIRLYLPYGVVRVSAPRISSNTFAVAECIK